MKSGEIYNCWNVELGIKQLNEFPIKEGYVRIYKGNEFEDVKISEFESIIWETEKDEDGASNY
jgi:hypothetical protein